MRNEKRETQCPKLELSGVPLYLPFQRRLRAKVDFRSGHILTKTARYLPVLPAGAPR